MVSMPTVTLTLMLSLSPQVLFTVSSNFKLAPPRDCILTHVLVFPSSNICPSTPEVNIAHGKHVAPLLKKSALQTENISMNRFQQSYYHINNFICSANQWWIEGGTRNAFPTCKVHAPWRILDPPLLITVPSKIRVICSALSMVCPINRNHAFQAD